LEDSFESTKNKVIIGLEIDNIFSLENKRYYNERIQLDFEKALDVMLSITHFFKMEIDSQLESDIKYNDQMEEEFEKLEKEEYIKDCPKVLEWIHKNGSLQYHLCIQNLLLQTLYTLNGTYYRVNDRDYEWEEEFDEIFVFTPLGKKFDIDIINFLLLPLYNSTHNTNYELPEKFQALQDELYGD